MSETRLQCAGFPRKYREEATKETMERYQAMTAIPKFDHFAEFQIAYNWWLDQTHKTENQREIWGWLQDEDPMRFENAISCLESGDPLEAAHYLQLGWEVAKHRWAEDKASREVAAPMDPDDVTTWNSKYVDEL